LSATAKESRYQKGKTSLDFTEATDSEWQWHQLGHMQVCTLLQTDKHTSTPPLRFFTGRMPFLPPNQQRQSTEGTTQPTREKKQTESDKRKLKGAAAAAAAHTDRQVNGNDEMSICTHTRDVPG